MSKFNVGDRVRALKGEWDLTAGKIYKVIKADRGDVGVTDDTGVENWMLGEDDYELVTEPEGPFYVFPLPTRLVSFDVLADAEADAKARGMEHGATTYGIFKGVKALKLVHAVQEVSFNG